MNEESGENQMKKRRKNSLDMGGMVLTGMIAMISSFTLLLLAGIITETDITLMDTERAVPAFISMSGLIWWCIRSCESKEKCETLKKASSLK